MKMKKWMKNNQYQYLFPIIFYFSFIIYVHYHIRYFVKYLDKKSLHCNKNHFLFYFILIIEKR